MNYLELVSLLELLNLSAWWWDRILCDCHI